MSFSYSDGSAKSRSPYSFWHTRTYHQYGIPSLNRTSTLDVSTFRTFPNDDVTAILTLLPPMLRFTLEDDRPYRCLRAPWRWDSGASNRGAVESLENQIKTGRNVQLTLAQQPHLYLSVLSITASCTRMKEWRPTITENLSLAVDATDMSKARQTIADVQADLTRSTHCLHPARVRCRRLLGLICGDHPLQRTDHATAIGRPKGTRTNSSYCSWAAA